MGQAPERRKMLKRKLHSSGPGQVAIGAAVLLLLAAAALLIFLQSPAEAQGNDRATSNLAVSSPNPGELVITWDAPGNPPDDYRVTWKKSDGKWASYKNANTALGGNAFPTGTSHTVAGLEEGTAYKARVRARYHNADGNVEQSGPWSDAVEITISATPSQDGDGDSNEGPSTNPPAKPTGLLTAASHDSVLLSWDDPGDGTITGYQVLRGPDADNLAALADDTGDADTSYTDSSVAAETTYVYAVRARNTHGLGPQADPVSVTTPAAPPAKPTGLLTAASHDSVMLSWTNPGDDSITGYQVLRGGDADNLAVLLDDTGDANASYTDSSVAAETTYAYAVRGRHAHGLGPQSDPRTVATLAAPEEDDPPTSARALAGPEYTLDGKELDTDDANCLEDTIGDVTDACTINIDTTTATFAVDGTLDSDDRLSIKIDRDKAAVDTASVIVDEGGLGGTDRQVELTFEVGRNLMRLWGDEDGSPGDSEVHFYRVNVLPYWELNGDRLSKSDDCRSTSDRTAAQITDADCIVTQFGNTAIIRFHNVINDQFNVYVHVNGTRVINEPDNTELAGSFTLDLQDGDNAVRVRLASKTGTHFSERYGNDKFHYKVETGVLVSNLGQVSSGSGLENPLANQFTTGSNPSGYIISKVGLKIAGDSGTVPRVSIYSDNSGRPGTSLKVLTNPSTIPPGPAPEDVIDFGADNYRLEPGTPYWIVVEKASGNEPMYLGRTTLTAEDPGSAAGWSIGDNGARLASGTWSTLTAIYGLAVKGTIAVSTDATLSALALTDASDNAVALVPAFASGTTSYSATVANSVSRIKVEPTANDSNADIEYLDDGDATLADADTGTADVFDFVLSAGANVVKVKVTAEDSSTTETYTVRIRRAEADLLVSNLGQPLGTYTIDVTYPGVAVQFTTGNETNGYSISQVRLDIAAVSGTIPKVSIYSDRSGQPGSSLKVLTNPGAIPTTITELDFGADDYKVDPSTPYWIVVERASGTGFVYIRATRYTAEDTGSAAGWSIINNGSRPSGATWSTITGFIAIPGIAVKGTVAQPASTDATLSALALTDASDNAVTLTPAFASDTTSYTATVDNSVSRIKVDPTANDSGVSIEYLDASDSTLTDADASTADVFDFDLNVGSNVVKVKVTAEDSTTTKTYTVTVNRVDILVSNLGQTSVVANIDTANPGVATQFTTGNETDGYRISQVRLDISAPPRTIPRVSIYSNSSGQPGSSLKVLTNPGAIPTARTEVDFSADNYRLDPSTPYWIVVERVSGSGIMTVSVSRSTAEDTGSAPGWSIGNSSSFLSGGTWSTYVGSIAIPQIAVKGTVAQTPASDDATLSAMTLKDTNDYAVALSPGFASSTTSYTATVANSISRIKVEPTTNDSNAKIEYLDASDMTLDDEDTSTADVFDFDLNVGSNVVKVKVTAEDRTTTKTYTVTVTVTRAADTTPVTSASDDATLSAMTLKDASDNAVALTPAFASGTTSYSATVDNSVSRIKVEPTANDSNAKIEYLDASDSTLDDEDTSTADVFDFDLNVGSNVVKVKVTAEDGTTTRTYTINVIRETLNNQGATGAPTITGTASVHQTLTAETTDIGDADGLTRASFSYQWIRVDPDGSESDISGAVSSTYKLTNDDEGKRLKVRVSFDDDNDNPELLTSAATAFPASPV